MDKIVVYSALIGNVMRDTVARPPVGCDARYVLFTNGPPVEGWERVEVAGALDKSPRMASRMLKTNPELWFPEADVTIWVDANARLLRPAAKVLAAVPWDLALAFRHHRRASLAEEAEAVVKRDVRHAEDVARQLGEYASVGFDPDAERPVTVTGFLARRTQVERVRTFDQVWQAQLLRHTLRDQLSVDYAAHATGLAVHYLPKTYVSNPYVKFEDHACPPTISR